MAKLGRRLRPRPPISSSEICPQTARCTILIEFPEERFAFAAYAVETAWWAALEKTVSAVLRHHLAMKLHTARFSTNSAQF